MGRAGRETESARERAIQREPTRDRQKDTDTETETETERQTEGDTERERGRETDTQTETEEERASRACSEHRAENELLSKEDERLHSTRVITHPHTQRTLKAASTLLHPVGGNAQTAAK